MQITEHKQKVKTHEKQINPPLLSLSVQREFTVYLHNWGSDHIAGMSGLTGKLEANITLQK